MTRTQAWNETDEARLSSIFFPEIAQRGEAARTAGTRFVHYTSAAVAVSIAREKKIWLRKASMMNDFQEIEYGLSCVKRAITSEVGQKFASVIDQLFPGSYEVLSLTLEQQVPRWKDDTYILSLSEHDDSEDEHGRLSMWRAYGRPSGVALVFNPKLFHTRTDALNAYSAPVSYFDEASFVSSFENIVRNIEDNATFIGKFGSDSLFKWLYTTLEGMVLTTKHPGFREEREWRVVYSRSRDNVMRVTRDIEVIQNIPQFVCKIPLLNAPLDGLVGIELNEIVERVIVGPCDHPIETAEALASVLVEEGVSDAQERVYMSGIPLRN